MDIIKVFRFLIGASLALFVLEVAITFEVDPEVPQAVDEYLENEAGPLASIFNSERLGLQLSLGALALMYLVAYIGSCLGMLMFRYWARATFICVAVVGYALTPVMNGTSLSTPMQATVATLHCLIDGAILAMLLFDPIKARFVKPAEMEALV